MKRDILEQDHYLEAFLRVINYAEGVIFTVNKFTDFVQDKVEDPAQDANYNNPRNQAATALYN